MPEPSSDFCPVDWIGVVIEVGAYAGPACSGDPGISREPVEVLAYGQTWSLHDVTCLSESTGLSCRDDNDNGFSLARAGWSLTGKGPAARAMFPTLRSMIRLQARDDQPGQVVRVSAPILRRGHACGELQEAVVPVQLAQGEAVFYAACFVSGTWNLTAAPPYPD